jgi:hypothetical protein
MGREEEDFAFPNDNIGKFAFVEYLQNHVALKLIKELFHRIIVKIGALVWAADHHNHHVRVFPDLLVSDGWLQQVSMLLDPVLKIECR